MSLVILQLIEHYLYNNEDYKVYNINITVRAWFINIDPIYNYTLKTRKIWFSKNDYYSSFSLKFSILCINLYKRKLIIKVLKALVLILKLNIFRTKSNTIIGLFKSYTVFYNDNFVFNRLNNLKYKTLKVIFVMSLYK